MPPASLWASLEAWHRTLPSRIARSRGLHIDQIRRLGLGRSRCGRGNHRQRERCDERSDFVMVIYRG